MTGIDEKALLERSRKGDKEAFGLLVERYQNKVYTLAYRYLGDPDEADDAAQEAFIKAYRGMKNFRGEAAFQTWLFQITANTCRDRLRQLKRIPLSLDSPVVLEDGQVDRQVAADPRSTPEALYEDREMDEYLHSLLQTLTPPYRMVFILREIQDLSYEEIAAQLDISIGTVKSRLNRARRALRDQINQDREHFRTGLRLTT